MVLSNDDDKSRQRSDAWRQRADSAPQRKAAYKTLSQIPVEPVYGPSDVVDDRNGHDVGLPGEYPYLRGVHPTGYRSRLWTMRMFAGFGEPRETNERFRFLMDQGETGLSVAFDMPTLYGYDHDDHRARGEFGKCGVAVSCLEDMQTVFQGIPLDQVTTSMTINSPAAIIWAMYIAAAEKQGASPASLGGTLAERYSQRVHRPERIHLPSASVHAPGRRHRRIRHQPHAPIQPHQHQRIPHPRSRQQRGAGAGVHSRRRLRIRPALRRAGHGGGRFRSPAQLLLQCP